MPEKTFKLEIVTPEKVVFQGDALSLSAPGVMGGFQVLYNHAPMLAEIGVGKIKLTEAGGREDFFATSGGFVEVLNNHVTVIAETVERSEEIDLNRAEVARERAKKKLAGKITDIESSDARSALLRAVNRIGTAKKS
jgi:F-type H+-transporting ATPase subunit epsilon